MGGEEEDNQSMTVHDKLALNSRYRALRQEAESEVKKLNQALEEKRGQHLAIAKKIEETNKGLLNGRFSEPEMLQPSTPSIPNASKAHFEHQQRRGFIYHDNQFRSKTSMSRVSLQPIEEH